MKYYFAKNIIFISIVLLIFSGVGCAQHGESLRLGITQLDENSRPGAYVFTGDEKSDIYEIGYVDADNLYHATSEGVIDVLIHTRLPETQFPHWDRLNKVNVVSPDAKNGLVVPDYVYDSGITTIYDLKGNADKFDGRITGIEPGAGIMVTTEKALEEYNLEEYELYSSSTVGMATELQDKLDNEEWIVATLWRPHWTFARMDGLQFLEDPKGVYGGSDNLVILTRPGFEKDRPEFYQLIQNYEIDPNDIESIMFAIDEGMSAEDTATRWVKNNPNKVEEEWLFYEYEEPEEPAYDIANVEEPEEPEEPVYELNKYAIAIAFIFVVGIVIQIAKTGDKRKTSDGKQKNTKNNDIAAHNIDNKSEHTVSSKPITKNEIPGGNFSGNNKIERMDEKNTDFSIKSAFNYKGATIQYKVKVENPTSEPIADIKVNLYVPDVFILSESTKSIPILKPSESNTVTFDIRPTGECGDCEVSGKVVYYDYKTKKTTEAAIPAKNVSIVCPMIKSKTINESEWRDTLTGLTKAEETTREIDIPASTLFDMASDVLQDMNLFMLDPKVNDSDKLYRAVAKFYGEGVKNLKYAAQIEVVGGSKNSKLILKAWAEKVEALTGFYHGILDELEKRTQIKGSINESIIQNYYHYGDKVDTKINDSLIQRSFNKDVHGSVSDDKDEYQTGASVEDYKINSKSYDEFNYSEVYIYLVDVAHKACGNKSTILNNIDNLSHRKSLYEKGIIVTYGDILKRFGKIPNNRAHQIELIKILDEINRNNKPILLSSLVVNGNKYLPSEQFFKKWTNNSWKSELEKIWDSYCDENGVY